MMNNQPSGDLWHLQDSDPESQWFGRNFHFDFSYIRSEEMKSVVKDYVWSNSRTKNKTLIKLQQDLTWFQHFATFAEQHSICMHSAAPNGSWCGDQRQLSAANGTLN